MFEIGKAGQEAREMERYRLNILGISECRWRGSRKSKSENTGQVKYSTHKLTFVNIFDLIHRCFFFGKAMNKAW